MSGLDESDQAHDVVDAFLDVQRAMYDGGDLAAVEPFLAEDVVWHVPGSSPIAGDFRGREAVLGYFERRRSLAGGTIRITEHVHPHHNDGVVRLADGHAWLGDSDVCWRTAGVYRVTHGTITEGWLVPLDQRSFDETWAAARPTPFLYAQRVRPQDCAASTMLGHPRFLEFFEAAFIECWRNRFGPIDASLGDRRRLTVAAVNVSFAGPVRCDDELQIAVTLDRITKRSIAVHYDAAVEQSKVASATSRYVCIDTTGEPTPLPDAIADVVPERTVQINHGPDNRHREDIE